jgi:hypothetical protein
MHKALAFTLAAAFGAAVLWSVACSGPGSQFFGDAPQGDAQPGADGSNGTGGGMCAQCVTDNDCSGQACAQFQGDSFCATACPNGDECGEGTTCTPEVSFSGQQVSVCVPNNNACGQSAGPPAGDGGGPGPSVCDAAPTNTCGTYVDPTTPAQCKSCTKGASGCQANGCYGGWWCDTSNNKCHAPPTNCSSGGGCGDASTPPPPNDGGPVTGTVGADGGTVSRLFFTAVGDTRPSNPTSSSDPTAGYPTAIIDQIYSDIAAMNPQPTFSVSTGDYMFATPSTGTAAPQLDLYLAARAKFSGTFFPAMGNHECTGATASNCGTGNADGITDNMTQFMNKLLGPIQVTSPYYSVNINATDSSWTSKFVFIAANAWDSGQSGWLSGVMAQPTTYTFVLRHEATGTSGPPGMASDSIINGYPYTLLIVGHSHTYGHPSSKEVLFGNGGAPLTGSGNYGYGVLSQRLSDKAITVDMYDYQSNQPDSSFHFAVNPDGSAAPP